MPFVSPPVYVPTYISWADSADAIRNGAARRTTISLIVCRLYQAWPAPLLFFTNVLKTAHVCRAKERAVPLTARSMNRRDSPRESRRFIRVKLPPAPADKNIG